MNQKELIKKQLYNAMSQMCSKENKFTYDRTFIASITEVLNDNKYKVKINDIIYETYSCNDTTYKVNDIVLVTVPQGKFSNMFIIGKRR